MTDHLTEQAVAERESAMTTITVPGKCHFDEDGWLRGPISITHYMSPNHYTSGFAPRAKGMVQHTEDGFTAGTVATFLNRASKVSAFFGVGEDGAAQQFLPVGRNLVAWAQGDGNSDHRSCECEDKTRTGDPMPPAQIATFAQILEACSEYDGFPLVITDDVNGEGLITHGDPGGPRELQGRQARHARAPVPRRPRGRARARGHAGAGAAAHRRALPGRAIQR